MVNARSLRMVVFSLLALTSCRFELFDEPKKPDEYFRSYFDRLRNESTRGPSPAYEVRGHGNGMPFVVLHQRPDNWAMVVLPTNERVISVGRNGRGGWRALPGKPIEFLSSAEVEPQWSSSEIDSMEQLEQRLSDLRTEGFATVNGHDVVVVAGRQPNGLQMKWYFDRSTGLLTSVDTFLKDKIIFMNFDDYRVIDGELMPGTIETMLNGEKVTLVITEVKHLSHIDHDLFVPEKSQGFVGSKYKAFFPRGSAPPLPPPFPLSRIGADGREF